MELFPSFWVWNMKNGRGRYTWRDRLRDKKKRSRRSRRARVESAVRRDPSLISIPSRKGASRRAREELPVLRFRGPSEAFTEPITQDGAFLKGLPCERKDGIVVDTWSLGWLIFWRVLSHTYIPEEWQSPQPSTQVLAYVPRRERRATKESRIL